MDDKVIRERVEEAFQNLIRDKLNFGEAEALPFHAPWAPPCVIHGSLARELQNTQPMLSHNSSLCIEPTRPPRTEFPPSHRHIPTKTKTQKADDEARKVGN